MDGNPRTNGWEPIRMSMLQEQLASRKRAAPRLVPLDHGPRDPWAEQPRPSTPAPHIVAAVVAHTGCASIYDLPTLRAAYLATDDPHARAAIEHAARAQLHRDGVPA